MMFCFPLVAALPPATDAASRRLLARQFRPIESDGVFLGQVVEHELGVRFIAVDARVTEMDQSIWPSVDYADRSARQLFKSGPR